MTTVDTLLRAIPIPTGSPITMQNPTDIPVMISVSMLNAHSPKTPKGSSDT